MCDVVHATAVCHLPEQPGSGIAEKGLPNYAPLKLTSSDKQSVILPPLHFDGEEMQAFMAGVGQCLRGSEL
jgi:hypothetical protein